MKFKIRNEILKTKKTEFKKGDNVALLYKGDMYTGKLVEFEKGYVTITIELDDTREWKRFRLKDITIMQ